MIDADRNQYVSLHTMSGKQLDQYNPDQQFNLGWGREVNNISGCSLAVPSGLVHDTVPDIVPWQHWISVWDQDGRRLHWTGPVVDWSGDRDQLTIEAKDIGALFKKQASPIDKGWQATDPAYIARELLDYVFEQQGLNTACLVNPDPRVDKFDFSTTAEDSELDKVLSQLVDLGLLWSVSMGRTILGPRSFKPIASLDGERDFMGGSPVLSCDGNDMANEIIVRGADSIARARVNLPGLNLQRIINIDSMFSVSNVQKVTNQYVRFTSKPRVTIRMPGNIRLHPDAPVELEDLIPTTRFSIEAYGILALTELTAMQVDIKQGEMAVSITLTEVHDDDPELEEYLDKNQNNKGGAV